MFRYFKTIMLIVLITINFLLAIVEIITYEVMLGSIYFNIIVFMIVSNSAIGIIYELIVDKIDGLLVMLLCVGLIAVGFNLLIDNKNLLLLNTMLLLTTIQYVYYCCRVEVYK